MFLYKSLDIGRYLCRRVDVYCGNCVCGQVEKIMTGGLLSLHVDTGDILEHQSMETVVLAREKDALHTFHYVEILK